MGKKRKHSSESGEKKAANKQNKSGDPDSPEMISAGQEGILNKNKGWRKGIT